MGEQRDVIQNSECRMQTLPDVHCLHFEFCILHYAFEGHGAMPINNTNRVLPLFVTP
jgi:hypothetical protein